MHYLSFIIFLFLALPISSVYAHSVNGQILDTQQAITLIFQYSTGDHAPYANIKVFSPEDSTIEYQNAHTDKQGYFSFLPNIEGPWTVVMSDNMGHRTESTIHVQQDHLQQSTKKTTVDITMDSTQQLYTSLLTRSIFGISLLFNIFIGLYIFIKRQKKGYTHAY